MIPTSIRLDGQRVHRDVPVAREKPRTITRAHLDGWTYCYQPYQNPVLDSPDWIEYIPEAK